MTLRIRPDVLSRVRSAPVAYPQGLEPMTEGPYQVRFARDGVDLEQVLRLRFDVFNRELGEGLEASWRTGLDRDLFDGTCHHLMLLEADSGEVVGTYRVQTEAQARAGAGLYCAGEFDLAPLGKAVEDGIELGRACIRLEHRQGSALFALWRGLAAYVAWSRKRYLFGCCSLTSRDPREGVALHHWLGREGYLHPKFQCQPHAKLACVDSSSEPEPVVPLPKLFGSYLRYGAKVVSGPALDQEFGTIDYLVLLDAHTIPARLWRLFFAGPQGNGG